jgi:inorganic pyrophosphatase/exopolyphosphatase
MKTIVTAGAKGADIDVFACAIAYAELLRLEGREAIPVVMGSFTSSVTPSVLTWGAEYQTEYVSDGQERFVLVDISDPDHFPSFVSHDRIDEVYDHRYGHEGYWQERLHENAHIDMVGSCGTLMWEEFKRRGKDEDISLTSAKLLLASIVSNNLAFRSILVTERDRSAYVDLSALTGLGDDWIAEYFLEQEKILRDDFNRYVRADIKVFEIPEGDFAMGQIEMWDATNLLDTKAAELDSVMSEFEPVPWVVNILNISKGFNLIYSKSERGKEIVEQKLKLKFEENVLKTNDLLMRKYLMKVLREANSQNKQ